MTDSSAPRIAIFLATSGHSGVDRAAKHLAPALARRGYRVDVVKIRRHGPYIEDKHPNLKLIEFRARHVFTAIPELIRYFLRRRPQVMLSDKDKVNRAALFARWITRSSTRLVVSFGTAVSIELDHRDWLDRTIQKFSMGRLYRFADQVIVTCEGVADDMSQYTGLPRHRIKAVASPVIHADVMNRAHPKPEHPWFSDPEVPVIVSCGELSIRKDQATLLRALARVNESRPVRLVLLGKGKQLEKLQTLSRELGIESQVQFLGYQDNPLSFMAHATLFAFSSRWEGLGFVIIEAMAVGTPVVSTDCPFGPRELLQDGSIGALVPVGDDEALAGAIAQALTTPTDPARLRAGAAPYEIEAATDAYLEAFALPRHWGSESSA